jgi:hypothetical protein
MGADYEKEKARREKKGWRDGREQVKQPRLDDIQPPPPQRVISFRSHPQSGVRVGETLVVQRQDGVVCAYSGLARIGDAPCLAEPIAHAIDAAHGMANGRVTRVDSRTGIVEVAVDCGTASLIGAER